MRIQSIDERTLTELDHIRITELIHRGSHPDVVVSDAADWFESVLKVADLVPSRKVSPDIVTMYSQVLLADPETGERRTLTLCYPTDAEPEQGFVSVLSPVGRSLLGLRVGCIARWRNPSAELCAAEVVAILFQPEDSGDYAL